MPFTGEPLKALLTDVVTPKYVYSLMNSLKCGSSTDKDFLVLTIGGGVKRVLLVTGFSINDYRIGNALIYMLLNKCVNHVYSIPTFSASQLSRWSIRIVPMVNPWPFNSWDIIRGKDPFYSIDDEGIPVRYDALTLKSKYSIKLHNLIHEINPELIVMLVSSDKWSISTPEPIRVNDYGSIDSDPADFVNHFSYESYPTIILSIPRDAEIREIASEIIQLIKEHSIKRQETKPLEVVVKVNGDIDNISNVLRVHGFLIGVDGNKLIIRASDKSQALLNALIDNNLIEHYFDVEISEIHLQ
ncbi:MAG: hypothetical protein ACP5GZ_10450 [Vulcanisaeta sp.]|uniref:Peptidase M14 carboxypeptidase A domain-containing protein n=1 Tax=Vulcanisaeta moutnovskia (strain 768-28) TaxID=985053 RepID=F0QUI2_VULM7|nr:hypothetical protein [Vulcanisaeta moutnovskia]ADY01891.1 hypothetical protein VMUT_1687 [Vulcanisaeta moutnovskia 768-28]